MKASFILLSHKMKRQLITKEGDMSVAQYCAHPAALTRTTSLFLNINGTDEKWAAMKRKSPPINYDNAVGCVLLWAVVTRPDRRTAMKWLRVVIRERNRKAQLP
jgi:hypothetical protein